MSSSHPIEKYRDAIFGFGKKAPDNPVFEDMYYDATIRSVMMWNGVRWVKVHPSITVVVDDDDFEYSSADSDEFYDILAGIGELHKKDAVSGAILADELVTKILKAMNRNSILDLDTAKRCLREIEDTILNLNMEQEP